MTGSAPWLTLWEGLEAEEVEGVLAHELAHIANRDVLVMTMASFFAMLAALLMRFGLYAGLFGGGYERRDMDHPPLEKRIARLAEIAREMGRPVA